MLRRYGVPLGLVHAYLEPQHGDVVGDLIAKGEQQGPRPLVGVPVNRPLEEVYDYYGQFGLSGAVDGLRSRSFGPLAVSGERHPRQLCHSFDFFIVNAPGQLLSVLSVERDRQPGHGQRQITDQLSQAVLERSSGEDAARRLTCS